MNDSTAKAKPEAINSESKRKIQYAKWDLDDARDSRDPLRIALAEAALNDLLDRNSCNT